MWVACHYCIPLLILSHTILFLINRFKPRNIVLSKEPSAEEKHAAAVAKAARRAEIMKENDEKLALENAVATAVGSGSNSKAGSGTNSGGGSGSASGAGSAKHSKSAPKESAATEATLDTVASTDSADEAEKRDAFAESNPLASPAPSAPSSPLRDSLNNQLLDEEESAIPMLKDIGPGLSTIAESNDNDSGTSTPISQRSFVRESTAPSLLVQAQRNRSKGSGVNIMALESPSNTIANLSRPGFNDSGSDLGIDAEPLEVNTDLTQSAEGANMADVSDTQSPSNSNNLTRSNTAESKEGYGLSGAHSGTNLDSLTSAARPLSGIAAGDSAGANTGAGLKPPGTPYTETGTEPDRHYMSGMWKICLLMRVIVCSVHCYFDLDQCFS